MHAKGVGSLFCLPASNVHLTHRLCVRFVADTVALEHQYEDRSKVPSRIYLVVGSTVRTLYAFRCQANIIVVAYAPPSGFVM